MERTHRSDSRDILDGRACEAPEPQEVGRGGQVLGQLGLEARRPHDLSRRVRVLNLGRAHELRGIAVGLQNLSHAQGAQTIVTT